MRRLAASLRRLVFGRRTPACGSHRAVPPLFSEGFPVVVCWSAKAGCTTMLKWFLHHVGLGPSAAAHHKWLHNYRTDVLMRDTASYLARCEAVLAGGDAEVVKVVRDPAARAVSGYIHAIRLGDLPEIGWRTGLVEWKRQVGLGGQTGVSFEQFLRFVLDRQATGQPLDVHFQPQWTPAWDRHVDLLIPLDRLAEGVRTLEHRWRLPPTDIAGFSESQHHNGAQADHRWPADAARFPATRAVLFELGAPPASALLDATTWPLVRKAYAGDYAAYGHLFGERPGRWIRRAA